MKFGLNFDNQIRKVVRDNDAAANLYTYVEVDGRWFKVHIKKMKKYHQPSEKVIDYKGNITYKRTSLKPFTPYEFSTSDSQQEEQGLD